MRLAIMTLLLAAAGCEQGKTVELLIGPDEATLSHGFSCLADQSTNLLGIPDLLPARAYTPYQPVAEPLKGSADFSLVIDFMTLGGFPPGCRGEELQSWCETHTCKPLPGFRSCRHIRLDNLDFTATRGDANLIRIMDVIRAELNHHVGEIYDQLRAEGGAFTADAPDEPVIVRSVMTIQPCSELAYDAAAGKFPDFNLSDGPTSCEPAAPAPELVGCAYSCPTLLDDAGETVTRTVDSTSLKCEPEVRVCATSDLRAIPVCTGDLTGPDVD